MRRKTAGAILILAVALVGGLPPRQWEASASNSLPQRQRNVIWHNPGDVARLNLAWGEGGAAAAPKPPFTFLQEDSGGTNPKIEVRDANGVVWGVKWGEEVNSEVFAARLVWAVGYFVEPSYFVARGRILRVTKLDRDKKYVERDGSFVDARFEKKDKSIKKLSDEQSWAYDENPFVGTRELNGLKIMVMLTSNWDSKDRHHASKSSNTKIFIVNTRAATEHRYVVSDWGGSMGKWGGVFRRGKWDCKGYADQSDDFVKGVKNGMLESGYSGQHTDSIKDNIPVEHARWLLGFLGKLSDAQIRAALNSCGASPSEVSCFAHAVRSRISHLQAYAASRRQ
ncbi:MAG TPA: hypothetical protein VFB82_01045 [Blastocatellia bacterium]|nr:hypothetical protein [Blastocatellia bacterium]